MSTLIIILLSIVIIGMILLMIFMQNQLRELKRASEENFKIIASDTIRNNSDYIEKVNETKLNALLTPLKMRLEDFNRVVNDSNKEASASRRSLTDQINRLSQINATISEDARNLSNALRGNNRFQGKWGEYILETLLQDAGLINGVNYKTQVTRGIDGNTIVNESGSQQRPDMIVFLPNQRSVIIDSKTSLSAYIDYCEASDKETADAALKRHVASIKRHIDSLSVKEYQKSIDSAVSHVLMFIPNDAALIAAINAEPTITHYATKHNIVIVSPVHLMSVIQLIGEMWRKDNQDRNAAEIAKMGGLLYDTVAAFIADMQNVDRALKNAQNAYTSAFAKLSGSPRSIAERAERLRQMGIKNAKRIDPAIISQDSEDN